MVFTLNEQAIKALLKKFMSNGNYMTEHDFEVMFNSSNLRISRELVREAYGMSK